MKALSDLSPDFVRSILRYDADTGLLYWRDRTDIPARVNKQRSGKQAGCVWSNGRPYVVIGIAGRQYLAHRLVWLIVTGAWPRGGLDHIDENRSNNRFSNLRESDQSQNMANRGAQRNNKSGFKGVYYDRATGRWVAMITHRKSGQFLGRFTTREMAARAYNEAAIRIFGEFAKLNRVSDGPLKVEAA